MFLSGVRSTLISIASGRLEAKEQLLSSRIEKIATFSLEESVLTKKSLKKLVNRIAGSRTSVLLRGERGSIHPLFPKIATQPCFSWGHKDRREVRDSDSQDIDVGIVEHLNKFGAGLRVRRQARRKIEKCSVSNTSVIIVTDLPVPGRLVKAWINSEKLGVSEVISQFDIGLATEDGSMFEFIAFSTGVSPTHWSHHGQASSDLFTPII